MIRTRNFTTRSSTLALPLAVAGAAVVGAAIGTGRSVGLMVAGAACGVVMLAVPVAWLVNLSVIAALTFRVLAPTASGPASALPDALLALLFLRIAVDASVGRSERPASPLKVMAALAGLFLALALASTVRSGDGGLSMLFSMRQFLRFPLWALAVFASGISWQEAKTLVKIVLAVSLIQLPFALHQRATPSAASPLPGVRFYQGDSVSGTFGLGGSGTEMVFLVIASLLWLALVLQRALPGWLPWVLAPVLVVPMALGSAAVFVILLPAALIALFVRAAISPHSRLGPEGVMAGVILLVMGAWAATSLALAPGFAGSKQGSATSLLSARYLQQYVQTTGETSPTSRLGFLRLAVDTDLRTGPTGVLLGQGPATAVIGPEGVQVGNTRLGVLAPASVQSVQRLILGYGFPALIVYVLMVVVPVGWVHRRARFAVDGTARALALALPVAAGVFLVAGVYNAAWTDPGVSAAFWSLVVAAAAGVSTRERHRNPHPMWATAR